MWVVERGAFIGGVRVPAQREQRGFWSSDDASAAAQELTAAGNPLVRMYAKVDVGTGMYVGVSHVRKFGEDWEEYTSKMQERSYRARYGSDWRRRLGADEFYGEFRAAKESRG